MLKTHVYGYSGFYVLFCLIADAKCERLGLSVFCHTHAYINLLNMFSRYSDILSHRIVQSSFQWERLIICFRAKSTEILTEIAYAYHRLNLRVDV